MKKKLLLLFFLKNQYLKSSDNIKTLALSFFVGFSTAKILILYFNRIENQRRNNQANDNKKENIQLLFKNLRKTKNELGFQNNLNLQDREKILKESLHALEDNDNFFLKNYGKEIVKAEFFSNITDYKEKTQALIKFN